MNGWGASRAVDQQKREASLKVWDGYYPWTCKNFSTLPCAADTHKGKRGVGESNG